MQGPEGVGRKKDQAFLEASRISEKDEKKDHFDTGKSGQAKLIVELGGGSANELQDQISHL